MIEWTDKTWNPVAGCKMVSAGCTNCYAQTMAKRLRAMAEAKGDTVSPYLRVVDDRGKWTGTFATVPERLSEPLSWKKPRRVFVNSMSDLFGEGVPFEFIAAVFGVMAAAPRHTYQVLTKRPERMVEFFHWIERQAAGFDEPRWARTPKEIDGRVSGHLLPGLAVARFALAAGLGFPTNSPSDRWSSWPLPNVWLGVSVEDQRAADERIPPLLQVPAAVRFISAEPLLGPITLFAECMDHVPRAEGHMFAPAPGMRRRHSGWSGDVLFEAEDEVALDWVIVGGESGPRARPCELAAIRGVVTQCTEAGVACFVKQLGSRPEAYTVPVVLRDRKGGDPSEWPEDLRVRQFPGGAS